MIGQAIEWGAEAVAFPRPVVQRVGDCAASVLCEPFHGRSLREVLPKHAVGVLVRTSLPRGVRCREVDRYARSSFDLLVSVELRTIVNGDRLEQTRMVLNQLDDTLVDGSGSAVPQLANQGCSGYALDQGHHAVLVARADHHIHLPVPNLDPGIDGSRPFRNVALAREAATLLLSAIAFAVSGPLAKVLPQGAASLAILLHATVDRLVTDLEQPEELEPPADLFRAKPVAQERLDELPLDSAELAVSARAAPPSVGFLLSHGVPIAAVLPAVSPQLATNRAAVSAHDSRDLCVRQVLLPK